MTNKERHEIKENILKFLTEEWNNHKRGRAHDENQPIFDGLTGHPVYNGTDLEMVMDKVVKGIWKSGRNKTPEERPDRER